MDSSATEFPLPLLITGVAGVAGYNALHYFRDRFPGQVIGMRQENKWHLTGPDIEACDAEDTDALRRLFDRYQFNPSSIAPETVPLNRANSTLPLRGGRTSRESGIYWT